MAVDSAVDSIGLSLGYGRVADPWANSMRPLWHCRCVPALIVISDQLGSDQSVFELWSGSTTSISIARAGTKPRVVVYECRVLDTDKPTNLQPTTPSGIFAFVEKFMWLRHCPSLKLPVASVCP